MYVVDATGMKKRHVVGLAPVSGMCNGLNSCTISEGTSFQTVLVAGHEMGHRWEWDRDRERERQFRFILNSFDLVQTNVLQAWSYNNSCCYNSILRDSEISLYPEVKVINRSFHAFSLSLPLISTSFIPVVLVWNMMVLRMETLVRQTPLLCLPLLGLERHPGHLVVEIIWISFWEQLNPSVFMVQATISISYSNFIRRPSFQGRCLMPTNNVLLDSDLIRESLPFNR